MKTQFKLLMIAFLAIMTACSPEDGKDGKDGEQGIQGPAGQDGNANVTSYLFENIPVAVGNSNPFEIPAITNDILEHGVVLGYIKDETAPLLWLPLPYSGPMGYLSIFYLYEGFLVTNSSFAYGSLNFRFVVIEGSTGNRPNKDGGQSSKEAIYEELRLAGVDINDYNAVARYYNLQN